MKAYTPKATGKQVINAGDQERKFEVICKVRPLQENERDQDIIVDEEASSVTLFNHLNNKTKEFKFNRVLGDGDSQENFIWTLVDEAIDISRKKGKGCLILCTGVMNSGKTYTVFGSDESPGILPALISALGSEVKLRALEIYNDVTYCLRSGKAVNDLRALECCQPIQINGKNMEQVIDELIRRRKTNKTGVNHNSSRSHAIFTVECSDCDVTIADLAGNERCSEKNDFTETTKINGNLLILNQCLTAFRDGGTIPTRRSKLTTVLARYFHPTYKIYMIVHLNRSSQMFHNNINVLDTAAISSQINHLQFSFSKNPSMAKIFHKSVANPKPAHTHNPKAKKVIQTEDDLERKHNSYLLEHYKSIIIGDNTEIGDDLDQQLRREDEKDRLLIEEIRATIVNGPARYRISLKEAEASSRIKMRQIFREEAMRQQREKQVNCGTSMGNSFLKDYYDKLQFEEEQKKREWEQEKRLMQEERERQETLWRVEKERLRKEYQEKVRQIEQNLMSIEEERRIAQQEINMRKESVNFGTSIGSSIKKTYFQKGMQEQDFITPRKMPKYKDWGSISERVFDRSFITNQQEVLDSLHSFLRTLNCDQRPIPSNPEGERIDVNLSNNIFSKQVAVVGRPVTESLFQVEEGMQAFSGVFRQHQRRDIIMKQGIQRKDESLGIRTAEKRKQDELITREQLGQSQSLAHNLNEAENIPFQDIRESPKEQPSSIRHPSNFFISNHLEMPNQSMPQVDPLVGYRALDGRSLHLERWIDSLPHDRVYIRNQKTSYNIYEDVVILLHLFNKFGNKKASIYDIKEHLKEISKGKLQRTAGGMYSRYSGHLRHIRQSGIDLLVQYTKYGGSARNYFHFDNDWIDMSPRPPHRGYSNIKAKRQISNPYQMIKQIIEKNAIQNKRNRAEKYIIYACGSEECLEVSKTQFDIILSNCSGQFEQALDYIRHTSMKDFAAVIWHEENDKKLINNSRNPDPDFLAELMQKMSFRLISQRMKYLKRLGRMQ